MSRKTKYSTLQQLLIRSAMIIYYVILGHVSILLHCTLVVGREIDALVPLSEGPIVV